MKKFRIRLPSDPNPKKLFKLSMSISFLEAGMFEFSAYFSHGRYRYFYKYLGDQVPRKGTGMIRTQIIAHRRSKKHEVREANMYFFVEATIALSVILS